MLVLSRRLNEKLLIPSIRTAVQVLSIQGGQVRLGVDAPPDVAVFREEIYQGGAKGAAAAPSDRVRGALRGRLDGLALDMDRLQRQVRGQLTAATRAEWDRLAGEFEDLARVVKLLLDEDDAPPAKRPVGCAR